MRFEIPSAQQYPDDDTDNSRKGAKSQRVALVRSIIREVAGLSPYEKRLLDVLKVRAGVTDVVCVCMFLSDRVLVRVLAYIVVKSAVW